jgi:Ni/Fe-hydrogenase 1 B-type cytochrome subunit
VADRATRAEHPLPAVLIHWVHLLSFFVLIGTGAVIHNHPLGAPIDTVRQVHFIAMYVFILTTVVRIYWAFMGAGSAPAGSLRRIPDYKHFAMHKEDWRTLGTWISYYLFLRKKHPPIEKYNPLQKLSYGYLFPLGTLVMALTGFALFAPTAGAMSWLTALLGDLNTVRLWHYLAMWVMVVLFMVHLYLVFAEDIKEAPVMLWRSVPRDKRVPGDYPDTAERGAERAAEA